MNPHRLTHDAQASALAPAVPTAFPGFALGACRIVGGGAMKSVLNCGGKQ